MAIALEYQAVYLDKSASFANFKRRCALSGLLFAVIMGKVWLQVEVTSLGYDIGRTKDVILERQKELSELELRKAVLLRRDVLEEQGAAMGLTHLPLSRARKLAIP